MNGLVDDLFKSKSNEKVDVVFECVSTVSDLSCLLCHIMMLGYEVLNDANQVFKQMKRMGVRVHCNLMQNVSQLLASNDNVNDLSNHKFIVKMSDETAHVIWFELFH